MMCHNHPTAIAWYYLKLDGDDEWAEMKVLLCLACSEAARDEGQQENLYEVPYGAEKKVKL